MPLKHMPQVMAYAKAGHRGAHERVFVEYGAVQEEIGERRARRVVGVGPGLFRPARSLKLAMRSRLGDQAYATGQLSLLLIQCPGKFFAPDGDVVSGRRRSEAQRRVWEGCIRALRCWYRRARSIRQ